MIQLTRGQVWRINFDPSHGSEIRKIRPAVIMSEEGIGRLPLQIVVPITDWKSHYINYPWFVRLCPTRTNGLTKESGADAYQVKSLSIDRLVECIGILEGNQVAEIAAAIAICVGYV